MNTHSDKSRCNHCQGNCKEYASLSEEVQRPALFCTAIELLVTDTDGIEGIQDPSRHNKCRKHGKHNTNHQSVCKALDCSRTQRNQYQRRDDRCDVTVKDG